MGLRAPAGATDALAKVALFAGCDRKQLAEVARLGTVIAADDGAVLTKQGRPGREFVLLLAGRARCSIDGTDVATFDAGDFFGELSLLDGGERTATIVTDGPAKLLVLDQGEFFKLLEVNPSIARKVLVELARRQRAGSTRELTV